MEPGCWGEERVVLGAMEPGCRGEERAVLGHVVPAREVPARARRFWRGIGFAEGKVLRREKLCRSALGLC